jgi:hypothetical protein
MQTDGWWSALYMPSIKKLSKPRSFVGESVSDLTTEDKQPIGHLVSDGGTRHSCYEIRIKIQEFERLIINSWFATAADCLAVSSVAAGIKPVNSTPIRGGGLSPRRLEVKQTPVPPQLSD